MWDAEQIHYVLNAVATITAMDDYTGLMRVFALIGLLVAIGTAMVKFKGEEVGMYLIFLVLFYGIMIVPKENVVIQDIATGTGTYTVSNVPLGLALFASAESQIGYWLTKSSETVMALPDDINFQNTGFMFSSRVITERQKARIYESTTFDSMLHFTRDCLYPELNNNPALYNAAMKSGDLWSLFGTDAALNAGRLVMIYNPDPSVKAYQITNCKKAYPILNTLLHNTIENDVLPRIANRLNPGVSSADAVALLKAQAVASDDFILKASRNAVEGIKQAAMINMLYDSTIYIPQMNGDAASAQVALSTAKAAASANSSYLTMAKIGESTLPAIRTAIHLIILFLFPIVMLMMIAAGSSAGLVVKNYVMALFWINLWAPIYVVINFLMTWRSSANAVAQTVGTDTLSYASSSSMIHSLISDQGIAGMLSLSVPVIAYIVVNKSAVSMTSMISSVMAPANSAAQQAGAEVGQGNLSAGNTNWGNVSMYNQQSNNQSSNKYDSVSSVKQDHGEGNITNARSDGAISVDQDKNVLRVESQLSHGQGSSLSESATQLHSVAQSLTSQRSSVEESLLAKVRAHQESLTNSRASATGATHSGGSEEGGSTGSSTSTGGSIDHKASVDEKNTGRFSASVGANFGGGSAGKQSKSGDDPVNVKGSGKGGKLPIGLKGEVLTAYDSSTGAGMSDNQTFKHDMNTSESNSFFDRLSKDTSFRTQMMGAESETATTSAQLAKREALTEAIQAVETRADSLQQQASRTESDNMSTSVNPDVFPQNWEQAVAKGKEIENNLTPEGVKNYQQQTKQELGQPSETPMPTRHLNGDQVKGEKEINKTAQDNISTVTGGSTISDLHGNSVQQVPGSSKPLGPDNSEANKHAPLVDLSAQVKEQKMSLVETNQDKLDEEKKHAENIYKHHFGISSDADVNGLGIDSTTNRSNSDAAINSWKEDARESAQVAAGQVIDKTAGYISQDFADKVKDSVNERFDLNIGQPSREEQLKASGFNSKTGEFDKKQD